MKNIENKETKLNAGEALKILENKSFNETLPVIEERVREIISELSENETKIIARKLNLDFVNLLSEK
ncbi:MAG: hypothetical protein LBU14_05340 [Candidatus Peribacteria bacterium]|jgi:hypothetical protein|nr:hypothetical protein [Candidatus Peribacteria bacterium]